MKLSEIISCEWRLFAAAISSGVLMCAAVFPASAQEDELFIYDMHDGGVEVVTDTPGYGLYGASFSNNGKQLIHEYIREDPFFHELAITDLKTGETTPLGFEGDNAVWSPNGRYIAYGYWMDFTAPPKIVVIPAGGGDPLLELDWALEPSWSNNSRRVAYADIWWGHIGTIGFDGSVTDLASAGAWGCNPDYSPDGKLIVFERYECFWGAPGPLMLVPVDEHGEAVGDAYPLTSGDYYAGNPSFSNNGKTIVFSGDPDGDWDWGLYTISVYGGAPIVLHDRAGSGEFDPAFSKNGRYVVFSSTR